MKVTLHKKDSDTIDISDHFIGVAPRHIFGTINALVLDYCADACLIDFGSAQCEILFKADSSDIADAEDDK